MSRSPSICGVVLAAGASERMGRDKALLPWPPGKAGGVRNTFLGASIELLQPLTDMVIVVGGANSRHLEPVIYSMGAFLLENPASELGQFGSLQLAMRDVLNRGRDSAMVTLVDRPPVQPATAVKLHSEFLRAIEQSFWAVMPVHEHQHGYPILVAREMLEAVLRAPSTETETSVMQANEAHIRYIPVEDPRTVLNISTPEDYQQLALEAQQAQ